MKPQLFEKPVKPALTIKTCLAKNPKFSEPFLQLHLTTGCIYFPLGL
jgi:hypothetical protein